ncbi:MAG: hypothetical protein A2X41_02355 [Candidatus Margulisbacteria bacterium GWE2_39_32]|nr:MAG: hypothetical protein A2X41_02355 [Candidatus Margulisbacteria bacterium GWE2_39_32]
MITRIEAIKLIRDHTQTINPIDLPVQQTLGSVLAEPVYSRLDLPPFNKSAMDGYAVIENESATELSVIGIIKAGDFIDFELCPGQTVKIMTGARIPVSAGNVIIKEDVSIISDEMIRVNHYRNKKNICYQGEDVRKGDLIYQEGELVTPIVIANIISSGISNVKAYKKPSIAIITTGDELLEAGEAYQEGKIYNSNGPLLKGLLHDRGYFEVSVVKLPDDKDKIVLQLPEILNSHDLIVFTGGISVGEYDFTKESLEAVGGKLVFHNIAMKPGKPVAFFTWGHKPVFALPGNPVSVFLSFYLFVLPVFRIMQGRKTVRQAFLSITLISDFIVKNNEREQFIPVYLNENNTIEAITFHGSGHLLALNTCNAFLIVPKGTQELKAGQEVEVFMINNM